MSARPFRRRASAGTGLALAAALLASGCAQQVAIQPRPICDFTPLLTEAPPAEALLVPPVAGTMGPMPLNTVNIADVGITNKVLVQAVTARRTETGTVEVQSRLINCTDFPLQVEGRTHFMDAAQVAVEPPSAWRRVHLPARATAIYGEKSLKREEAQLYLIEIREGT